MFTSKTSGLFTVIVLNYLANYVYRVSMDDTYYQLSMLTCSAILYRSTYSWAYDFFESRRKPGEIPGYLIACALGSAFLIYFMVCLVEKFPEENLTGDVTHTDEYITIIVIWVSSMVIGYCDVDAENKARKIAIDTAVADLTSKYEAQIAALKEKLSLFVLTPSDLSD